jgi:hypothetical protein
MCSGTTPCAKRKEKDRFLVDEQSALLPLKDKLQK